MVVSSMERRTDLVPCPFCGGTEHWVFAEYDPGYPPDGVVKCPCGASIRRSVDVFTDEECKRAAVDAWNERASITAT